VKTQDEDLREHAEFRGLRNNVDAAGFDLGDLEVGLNIDIDDARFLKFRKGYSAVVAAGAYSSLWAAGSMCLAVIGNALRLQGAGAGSAFPSFTQRGDPPALALRRN